MSDQARAWCWDHSPFTGTKFIVHFAMCDLANDTHDNRLWMADAKLAQKARTTTKTVQRTRLELIEMGMLEVVGDGTTAPGRPVEYRVLMPYNGGHLVPNGGHLSPTTVDISSLAPITNQSRTKEPTRARAEDESDPLRGFDVFWSTYPARSNRKLYRAKAEAEWRKIDLPTKRLAYRACVNYRAECDAGAQRAKDAFRWLRDRCWLDFADPVPIQTQPKGGCMSEPEVVIDHHGNRVRGAV